MQYPFGVSFLASKPADSSVRDNVVIVRNDVILMYFQTRNSLWSYSINSECLCIENISIDWAGH